MDTKMQNPGDGRGFAEKVVVSGDETILPSPADLGNDNSAARVQELRNRGHLIDTVRIDDVTAEGNVHRVALYLYRGMKGAE